MNERRWWLTAGLSLFVATSCFTVATHGYLAQSGGPPTPQGSPTSTVIVPSETPGLTVGRSEPVTLRIPAIGVAVSMSKLGLNSDGTVEVPTDFQQPGWFRLGPTPGQIGSAVILGHVDSSQGPAVFYRLGELREGDRVSVTLTNGTVAHFIVNTVVMYPKTRFPARRVYGSHDLSALQLVTCGGVFDRKTGHYLSNVVVYTSLVAATQPLQDRHGRRDA